MKKISLNQAKGNLGDFIQGFYHDITSDFRLDLKSMLENKEPIGHIIEHAENIKDFETDEKRLLEKVDAVQNLFELLRLITLMTDDNGMYPFLEQEELIFKEVFEVQIVNEDEYHPYVELKRASDPMMDDDGIFRGPTY